MSNPDIIEIEVDQNQRVVQLPFDLEQAKAGKPIITRDGRKARILAFDLQDTRYPICAAVTVPTPSGGTKESVCTYTLDGYYSVSHLSDYDLHMLVTQTMKTGYVNIYRDNYDDHAIVKYGRVYETEEEAIHHLDKTSRYLGTSPVQYYDDYE